MEVGRVELPKPTGPTQHHTQLVHVPKREEYGREREPAGDLGAAGDREEAVAGDELGRALGRRRPLAAPAQLAQAAGVGARDGLCREKEQVGGELDGCLAVF